MFQFKVSTTDARTTSELLNDLVIAYREGEPGSSGTLLEAFKPLLNKYFRILHSGNWDGTDRDTLEFLKMFLPKGCDDYDRAAMWLCTSFKRLYDTEDLSQELVLILLTTAKQYTNISHNFKYVAEKRIKKILSNSLIVDKSMDEVQLDEVYEHVDSGAIDRAWVNGITTGDGWDQLSVVQRAILKSIYSDGLAAGVAAKKLKMSVRSLHRQQKVAKEILRDYFRIKKG